MSATPTPTTYRAVLDIPETPAHPAPQAFTRTLSAARSWASDILQHPARAEGDRVLIYRVEEVPAETWVRLPDVEQKHIVERETDAPEAPTE